MSIRDYLSQAQIDWFINTIKSTCERENREDQYYINLVGPETYKKVMRCRGAHDVTGKVHLALLARSNRIEGIDSVEVGNGAYTQSEQRCENAIIQVYHSTNKLDSTLVTDTKERAQRENKSFFCLKFFTTPTKKLYKIVAVCYSNKLQIGRETLYSQNVFSLAAG